MGTPIKVGDSFSNFEDIKNSCFRFAANSYNNANRTSTYSFTRTFNVSLGLGNRATGTLHGKEATVILDGLHDKNTVSYNAKKDPIQKD